MIKDNSPKKIKSILEHRFTFPILVKILNGHIPAQIAEQLHVTAQNINYHTERMIDCGLISKYIEENKNGSGILWRVTDKGLFILKQKLTWSATPFKNNPKGVPIRLENVSIGFKIYGNIHDNERFHWIEMKNGVSKCTIDKNGHTIELIKSEKQQQGGDGSSVMLIHLSKQYCFNWTQNLIRQSYVALHYAKQASLQFGIEISDFGYPVKRPHIAFEHDLIAHFIAASHTAELSTELGEGTEKGLRAWIDSSNSTGEVETNDPDYSYSYLSMPIHIVDIRETVTSLYKMSAGYSRYWHPIYTNNN